MQGNEIVGRRAAYLTLGLALFVVVALLLIAANLAILLTAGAEPNDLETSRQTTWLQWRGRFLIILPWWVFFLPVVGWLVVLRLTWLPERNYLRKVGPLFLIAGPAIVAVLSIVTALSAAAWARWFYRDGWEWYLIPAALLVSVGIIAAVRARQLRRARPTR